MATFMKGMQLIPSGVYHLKMIGCVTNQIMEQMFSSPGVLESSFPLSSLCSSATSIFYKGQAVDRPGAKPRNISTI